MLHPTYYAKNYAGIMGAGLSGSQVSSTSTLQRNRFSQGNPTNNPQVTVTLTLISNQNALPQQFLNQLSNILQQATSSSVTRSQAEDPDTTEDDHLSAASQPVQSTLPVVQPPIGRTPQVNPVSSQSAPLLFQPTQPPIPTKTKEKIARGEYIDFTTILPVPDPHTSA